MNMLKVVFKKKKKKDFIIVYVPGVCSFSNTLHTRIAIGKDHEENLRVM